ncbi:hypothetical protein IG631_21799 [Alternaria alternata]|nr:hypothetical protein IG631_21799 [Alternaria alternata]
MAPPGTSRKNQKSRQAHQTRPCIVNQAHVSCSLDSRAGLQSTGKRSKQVPGAGLPPSSPRWPDKGFAELRGGRAKPCPD